jgi:hypothetical protein
MKVEITPQPNIGENTRFIRFISLEISDDTIAELVFHYERSVYIGGVNPQNEVLDFRKSNVLRATSKTFVDNKGDIVENGTMTEWEFYMSAIFSGKYTREQLIELVIKLADTRKRFD